MGMVALSQRIASAYAVQHGRYGEVQDQARARQVSRQRIYRESAWVTRKLDSSAAQQEAVRQGRIAELEQRNQELTEQVAQAVILDADKQAELTNVAHAMGVSLPTLHALFEVLLPGQAPSVAKLGRWTKSAGEHSGVLLEVFDEYARERVREALADEIYVSDPVLMVVEPASLCWTTGQRLTRKELSATAWSQELGRYVKLEGSTSDAGVQLHRGVKELNEQRRAAGLPQVREQLDHFHSLRDGGRALKGLERRLGGVMNEAWRLQGQLRQDRRNGRCRIGLSNRTRARWAQAEKLFEQWSAKTALWQKVKEALPLVTPEGELNTRERAAALLAETLPQLPDEQFAKSKRLLQEARTLTFLDRVQERLAALPVPAEIRQAAIRQETLRRCPEKLRGDSAQAAALRGVLLVCAVILSKAGEVGQQAVEGVRAIFRNAWRASSLVECINSVLRMQQARHRKMTQGMINLKRLYWNSHVFRTGRRRGKSPYELLDVPWPPGIRWWDLLKWSPERLRLELSALKRTA